MLRRLAKGVGANALGQLINTGLQLAIVPILASHWGLERYGIWLLITTVPFYLLVSDLGFARASSVDMTLRTARGDTAGALATFHTNCAFALATTTVLAVLIALLCTLLPDRLFGSASVPSNEVRLGVTLMSAYGVLILNGGVFSGGFQSTGHYALESLLASGALLLEGVSAMVVAIAGGGLVDVATSYLVCRVIVVLVYGIAMHRVAPGIYIGLKHANAADARRLMPPALSIMAIPMAQSFILQGTALAIGAAVSAAAVPAFTTTRTLTRFGIQLVGTVARASMPEFSVASARDDHRMQTRLIVLVLVTSVLALVPIAAALFVAGPRIIAVWTGGTVTVSPLLMALMTIAMLVNGAWAPLSMMVMAVNRQSLFTHKFIVLAALSVVCTYFLGGHIGAVGGALATLLVDVVMCLVMARVITRLFATPGELIAAARRLPHDGWALYGRLRAR